MCIRDRFEMRVGQQELEEVKEKFEISNLCRKDGQIIVRVVTQKRPDVYKRQVLCGF